MGLPVRLAVLDSSVVIKWFRQGELLRAQALSLRSAYLDGVLDLAAPDLLIYEVANALRYKPDFSTDDVAVAVQSLYDVDMAIVPVSARMAVRAIQIARQHDVSVYDAVFVACAEDLSAAMITADDILHHRLRDHPAVIHLANIPLPKP